VEAWRFQRHEYEPLREGFSRCVFPFPELDRRTCDVYHIFPISRRKECDMDFPKRIFFVTTVTANRMPHFRFERAAKIFIETLSPATG